MSKKLRPVGGVLQPEEIRIVQEVFNRLKSEGLLPEALEEQRAFAAYTLKMYLRGMVIPEGLYALCLAAAKARTSSTSFGGEQGHRNEG